MKAVLVPAVYQKVTGTGSLLTTSGHNGPLNMVYMRESGLVRAGTHECVYTYEFAGCWVPGPYTYMHSSVYGWWCVLRICRSALCVCQVCSLYVHVHVHPSSP